MKFLTRTTTFVLLAVALVLSACAPIVAQGAKEIDTRLQMTPTTAPAPTQPAVTNTDDPNLTDANWKSYTSDTYGYMVKYPVNWTVSVNTTAPAGSGKSPEYVTFSSGPDSQLPNITIYALTGLPPFTGHEDCKPTLVFHSLDLCQISVPAGQIPAAELNVFHNGDQFFQIALQYEKQSDKGIFDLFMRSFQFTRPVYNGPAVPVLKTYASKEFGYTVNYPADWNVQVEASADKDRATATENVYFTPAVEDGSVTITISAEKGTLPFSTYLTCESNLVFHELKACRITIPGGQNHVTEQLIFEKGDTHFVIAMQHTDASNLETFDRILTSFEFFK